VARYFKNRRPGSGEPQATVRWRGHPVPEDREATTATLRVFYRGRWMDYEDWRIHQKLTGAPEPAAPKIEPPRRRENNSVQDRLF
jgi:hypothetical protein